MNSNLSVTTRPTVDISTLPPTGEQQDSPRPEGLVRRDEVDPGHLPSNPGKVRGEGSKEVSQPTKLEHHNKPNLLIRILAKIPDICANIVLFGMPAIMKAMEGKGAPEPYTFTLPGTNGRKVELDGHIGPKKIPKGMTHAEVQERLQEKINDGYKVYQDVTSGARKDGCTVEDMTNLMFFLQARGEDRQGSCFKDGAFSLPDPDNRIRNFLDSCPQAYQRSGSFPPDGTHRGMDAYGSGSKLDQLLPHHMKTLHYCTLPSPDGQSGDRIYLKMEPHGSFLSRPKGGLDPDGPSRPMNRHDIGASFKHVFQSTKTDGAKTFTERMPAAIKNEYRELMRGLSGDYARILDEGKPFSPSGGIRVMLENALAILELDQHAQPSEKLTDQQRAKVLNFVDRLHQKYPDPDIRVGNEIIFSEKELLQEPEPEVEPPPLTQSPKQTVPIPTVAPLTSPVVTLDGTAPSIQDSQFSTQVSNLREAMEKWQEDHFEDGVIPRPFANLTKVLAKYEEVVEALPENMSLFSEEDEVQESVVDRERALAEYTIELRNALLTYSGQLREGDEEGHEAIEQMIDKLLESTRTL